MSLRPYSATVLALGGAILMILGLYFVFLRPSLLPEDPRYMGTSLAQIQETVPGLLIWLRRVFWVMGGYMFATGLLTFHLAVTAFRTRAPGSRLRCSSGWNDLHRIDGGCQFHHRLGFQVADSVLLSRVGGGPGALLA